MLRFVVTFHPKYGYTWELLDNRGRVIARPGSTDYWSYKESVREEIKLMKLNVFSASIQDSTPAKAPG